MRGWRTIPPAAPLLHRVDLWHALEGLFAPERSLAALESSFRSYFGVKHVFFVSSGTTALAVTLTALRSLSAAREVVIPAYTCFSVPAAVLSAGLQLRLCDIDPSTFDFDHTLLEKTVNDRTLCVVAHHLFGVPADLDRIRAVCRRRGIFVVEDAAQAMGIEIGGRRLGTLGDVGIFSLGRGKNITCGSGGVIVTNSDDAGAAIAAVCRQMPAPSVLESLRDLLVVALMAIFIRPRLYWIPDALPVLRLGESIYPRTVPLKRLSGMKAALLRDWRDRLTRSNRIRSTSAEYFGRRLQRGAARGPSHPYLRLPVLVASRAERDAIHARSRASGLGLSRGYPAAVSEIPEIRHLFDGERYPGAAAVADRLLTVPTHHLVSDEDRGEIVKVMG